MTYIKHFKWITLIFASLISIFSSLLMGDTFIHSSQLIKIIFGHDITTTQMILVKIRLPRTLSAFVTGGLLALSGTLMQVLLRNPLADPYILGISGGSAIFSLIFILLGISGYGLTGGAWCGSILTTFLVFFLGSHCKGWNPQRMLLTGIALSSGFSALISCILILCPDKQLHSLLFWLLGDLSFSHMPYLESIILFIGLLYSFLFANELNLLMRGEREAKALGVNTSRIQIQLYFLTTLLTASAVALAGCIGFVGLIIPHLLRLSGQHNHRLLLPCSVLLGGTFLTVADALSRTLFAPQQLPVGILMAFLGIPLFILLLNKNFV